MCFCDYEYVQQCRKFSTEVKVVLTKQTPSVYYMQNISTQATELDKNLHKTQEIVSQKEINNLLGSFYTTEQRFHNIITAKDLVVRYDISIPPISIWYIGCIYRLLLVEVF